jgi:protocatechuate 3,4-dioxygenase beta subunit
MRAVTQREKWALGAGALLLLVATTVAVRHFSRRAAPARKSIDATAVVGAHELAGRVLDRVGRPVGGARVAAQAELGNGGAWATAMTDGDGRYRLALTTGAAVRVRAEAAGFVSAELRAVEPPQAGLELTLARTLALDGLVRSHGRPAADVEVTVGGPGRLQTLKSGPDGAFTVASLAEGRYAVRAGRAGEAAFVDGVVVAADADGGSGVLLLDLQPATVLTARVRDRGGRAIAGAEVTLTEADGTPLPRTLVADDAGDARFVAVLPGNYAVDARAEGYYPAAPHAQRVGKTATMAELRLERGAVISGRVLDERAQPVAGAEVEVAGESPDGTPIAVTASSAGLPESLSASLSLSGQLEAAGELGILRGKIPFPPLGAPAPVAVGLGPTQPTPSAAKMFVTDGSGNFRVIGLPAGKLVVAASHPDFARGAAEPLVLAAGGEAQVTVVLNRGVRLTGRVSDERGQPIVGAEVSGDDGATLAMTDGHGEFELAHVARALTLTAHAAGFLPASRAASPSERGPFDLTLRRAEGHLAGDVVDDRGAPVSAARVEIAAPSPRAKAPAARWFTTDSGGHFSAFGLGPGPFHVAVSHADFAAGTFDDVAAGDDAHFVLVPGGGLDGDVRDARSGAVPAGTRVELTAAGTKPRSLTLVSGRFSANAVPPGHALLAASAPGYVAWSRSIDIVAGERLHDVTVRDLRIELERGGSVTGRLRDDHGDALAGVVVTVAPAAGPHVVGRTDRDGQFRIEGVAAGRVRVSAEASGAAAAEEVDVRADDESRVELRAR